MKRRSYGRRNRRYTNRNRQWGSRQNTFSISMKGAVPIVLGLIVLVGHLASVHMRDAVQEEIQREESRSVGLQEQLQREKGAWARMKTSQALSSTLAAHGVSMSVPRPSQRVAMAGRDLFQGHGGSGVYAANR